MNTALANARKLHAELVASRAKLIKLETTQPGDIKIMDSKIGRLGHAFNDRISGKAAQWLTENTLLG